MIEPVSESDIPDLLSLAAQLGQESIFGSRKSFRSRLSRISASAGSPALIERYWLSLPAQEGAILEAEAV